MYSSHAHAALLNWPQRQNVSQMFCEFGSRVFEMHLRHLTALTVHLLCVQWGEGGKERELCMYVRVCVHSTVACWFSVELFHVPLQFIHVAPVKLPLSLTNRTSFLSPTLYFSFALLPLSYTVLHRCPSLLPFTASLCCLCSRHSRSCSVVNKFAFLSILMATEHTHTHTHSHTCTQRHIHTRIHTYWHTLEQRQTVCWMNVLKVCKVYSCNSHKYCGPTSEAKTEPALGQGLRRCCLYSTRAAACWKCMQP